MLHCFRLPPPPWNYGSTLKVFDGMTKPKTSVIIKQTNQKRKGVVWAPYFERTLFVNRKKCPGDSCRACAVSLWGHSVPDVPYEAICMSYQRVSIMSNYCHLLKYSLWYYLTRVKIAWVIVLTIKEVHSPGNLSYCLSLRVSSVERSIKCRDACVEMKNIRYPQKRSGTFIYITKNHAAV